MRRSQSSPETRRRDVEIEELRLAIDSRFGELTDPSDPNETSCCPLGLVFKHPTNRSPEPNLAAEKTGLPLQYCQGLAEGWDNARGFYVPHLPVPLTERSHYLKGYGDGRRARRRWFLAHPRAL